MNAVSYARISNQGQSHHSLEGQARVTKDCCSRNGLTLLASFTDDGEKSYTFDRPGWLALEAYLKKRKDVDYVILLELDRFSRNLAEGLLKIKELSKKYGVKVISAADNLETDFEDPGSFMIRAFKLMMAESELHNIRKRTKAGILQGALSGRFMSTAPYGYKNVRDSHNKAMLEIVEDQARIVRLIFRDFLGGMGQAEIGRKARKMGFRRSGKMAITNILRNGVYAGLIPIPEHKGRQARFTQGLHVPLISEIDYWTVQERLVKKPKVFGIRAEVPLRGVLRCWCGRRLTAGNSKSHTGKTYWYYECLQHRVSLPAKRLHLQFDELIANLSLDPSMIETLRHHVAADIGEKLRGREGEMTQVERELKRLSAEIKAMETRYLKGKVSERTFNELIVELRAAEAHSREELAAVSMRGPAFYRRMTEQMDLLGNFAAAFKDMDLGKRQETLRVVFGDGFFYKDGIYRTHFLHPAFSHNELMLKQKGLLMVEQSKEGDDKNLSRGGRAGTYRTGQLEAICNLLELIA